MDGRVAPILGLQVCTKLGLVVQTVTKTICGLCGSRNYCIGRRATDVQSGNAGPKLHWLVQEKSGFPARPRERCFLEENKAHDGDI